jgi:hypothetical protein
VVGWDVVLALARFALAAPLGECARTFDTAELLMAADRADEAFIRMDEPGFLGARDDVIERTACLGEPIARVVAARVHRVQALAAFVDGQERRVAPALAGLVSAEPGHQLPLDLVPDGHRVRAQLPSATLLIQDPTTVPAATLPSGWFEVDGMHAQEFPRNRAAIVQRFDGAGAVVETRYLWPGEDPGAWAAGSDPVPAALTATTQAAARPAGNARTGRHVALGAATLASLVATGALFALAAENRSAFDAGGTPEELVAMQARSVPLTWGWVGAAAGGVALGALTVLTW